MDVTKQNLAEALAVYKELINDEALAFIGFDFESSCVQIFRFASYFRIPNSVTPSPLSIRRTPATPQ